MFCTEPKMNRILFADIIWYLLNTHDKKYVASTHNSFWKNFIILESSRKMIVCKAVLIWKNNLIYRKLNKSVFQIVLWNSWSKFTLHYLCNKPCPTNPEESSIFENKFLGSFMCNDHNFYISQTLKSCVYSIFGLCWKNVLHLWVFVGAEAFV